MKKMFIAVMVLTSLQAMASKTARVNAVDSEINNSYTSEFLALIVNDDSKSVDQRKKECRELCFLDFEKPTGPFKACILNCEKIK